MEEYLNILSEALKKPLLKVEADYLSVYFEIIHKDNYEQILTSNDDWNQAFDAIDKQYQIDRYKIHHTPIENNLRKMISAIALISSQEQKWLLMPLIVHLDDKHIFFQYLIAKPFFNDLNENIIGVLDAVTITGNLHGVSELHWEADAFRNYEAGIVERNIRNIYDFIQLFERGNGFIPSSFITLCVFVLYRNSFESLVQILEKKHDVLTIIHLINGLSVSEKLKVACVSKNIILHFEALRETVYFQKGRKSFDVEEQDLIVNLIVELSKNREMWVQFLEFYLEYPLRSPLLFKPLGVALSQLSQDKIESFIVTIKIDKYVDNESKSSLNTCFSNISDGSIQELIAKEIFERWLLFIENYDGYINSMLMSNVIDINMHYVTSSLEKSVVISSLEASINTIKELNNQWFRSEQEQVNQFYKYISKLFVYSIAIEKYELMELKAEVIAILDSNLEVKYESNQNVKTTCELFADVRLRRQLG